MSIYAETLAERKAVEFVGNLTNGINHGQVKPEDVAFALTSEHPTLLGRLCKAVGLGIMLHSTRDPKYVPHDTYAGTCGETRTVRMGSGQSFVLPDHAPHDGRLDCTTVVGAELMARQSFI